jgi:hypothetical protein
MFYYFDYEGSFESAVAALKRERRYRVFADLSRRRPSLQDANYPRRSIPNFCGD